jgi:F-type H+-transporting ATPase subunit delta
MRNTKVATRYALAILEAVPESITASSVIEDLQDILASISASSELKLFFESPIISEKKKAEAIQALFAGRVSEYVISVLLLLVEKGRENIVTDIIEMVLDLRRQQLGIIQTRVSSAVALSDDQREKLTAALAATSGKNIEAEYSVDPALMGGVLVRLGDTVYDGSVQQQLRRLRTRFVSGI